MCNNVLTLAERTQFKITKPVNTSYQVISRIVYIDIASSRHDIFGWFQRMWVLSLNVTVLIHAFPLLSINQ